MSLLGVVVMAICTPLGVSHLFTVLSELITSPKVNSPHSLSVTYCIIYLCTQPTTNVEEELEELRSEEIVLLGEVQVANGGGGGEGQVRERRSENGVRVEGQRTLKQIQHRRAELGLCSVLCPLQLYSISDISSCREACKFIAMGTSCSLSTCLPGPTGSHDVGSVASGNKLCTLGHLS